MATHVSASDATLVIHTVYTLSGLDIVFTPGPGQSFIDVTFTGTGESFPDPHSSWRLMTSLTLDEARKIRDTLDGWLEDGTVPGHESLPSHAHHEPA